MAGPPTEPHPSLVPFEPAAQRSMQLFGTTVSLVLVPGRRARSGRVDPERPALQRSPADRILGEETFWRSGSLAMTPNRFPFAREQRILWMAQAAREPDHEFWLAAIEWVAATNGTALLNNIGAAATIPRAHVHLLTEREPFLDSLPERTVTAAPIVAPAGCELVQKDVPFCLLGVRGQPDAIATALLLLADARLTAAWNVIVSSDTAWVVPRRIETPTPWFPQAVGAAELWGRWCYLDEQPFTSATPGDLEQALLQATMPTLL